ncbi:MAG: hypothetical protein IPI26_08160 [Elusimicrobia bacterium]|nr:hypothetical protein [Elusimicrobiota bacterium]
MAAGNLYFPDRNPLAEGVGGESRNQFTDGRRSAKDPNIFSQFWAGVPGGAFWMTF